MTTFSDQFITAKMKFAELLRERGWTPVPEKEQGYLCAVASKDFETYVGTKTALAFFNPSTESLGSIKGDYQSEGRNALSTLWLSVGADATDEALASLADGFVLEAESTIAETYAMRLMRA